MSAHLVNSPITALQQYHYGAIHPFIPDPFSHPTRPAAEEWRPSRWGALTSGTKAGVEGADKEVQSPYEGHPWLLMTANSLADASLLLKTPMGDWQGHLAGDPAFGPGWQSWAIAAQQLYSLLYNLEMDEMERYFFGRRIRYDKKPPAGMVKELGHTTAVAAAPTTGNPADTPPPASPPQQNHSFRSAVTDTNPSLGGEALYDTQFQRYNLNFIAVWGRDVKLGMPIGGDDEADMTQWIPRRLGRPFVIDTRAVVAHGSFSTQHGGVRSTDLLDRWRAVANEMVCDVPGGRGGGRGKSPWDMRCKGF